MRKAVVVLAVVVALWEGWTCDCSEKSYDWDWNRQDPNVTFKLYTRENKEYGVKLPIGKKQRLLNSGFKRSLPAVFISHGFTDDAETDWIKAMRKEILSAEDVNVITVDWSECSKNIVYNDAVSCMKDVGVETGKFLRFLQAKGNFDMGRVHLIGHSLGAQMFALAAKAFPEEATIGRITGLDPAAPLFRSVPKTERLSNTSAKVVDVLHTCTFFLGIRRPIGTVDFYPNGGFNQLGCKKMDLRCHHGKSAVYFTNSISTRSYVGRKCKTEDQAAEGACEGEVALMGYHLWYRSPGIYYVPIN